MAAADTSLSLEFECVICSERLHEPKIIGPCNHTFCKGCINDYWLSLGSRRAIPCPECRRNCPIPPNGSDGLKDNFKLSSIMEKYYDQLLHPKQKTANRSDLKCILCPNSPHSICKECDLEFCFGCTEQHDGDPQMRDHDLFGLCPSHGNGLFFFCTPCKKAVCSRCRIYDHNQGDHDVTPVRPLVHDLMSTIHTSSTRLADGIEEHKRKLSLLHHDMRQKLKISQMVQRVCFLDARRKDMQKKLQQGWVAVSIRLIYDSESIANLTSISQGLMDSVRATMGGDTNASLIEENGRRARVFKQLKKESDVSFSADDYCRPKRIDKMVCLPEGRLASSGRSKGDWDADVIYFHDSASFKLTGTIGDNVHRVRDMVVSFKGELVLTRSIKPPIRVVNPNTGAYRDIVIIFERNVVEELSYIDTDKSGKMFVVAPRERRLLVLSPEGNVMQNAQLDCHVYGISYCAVNTIIYIATVDRILRFHWKDDVLSHVSKIPSSLIHGVDGFLCRDVCVGGDGELLVAGKMATNKDIVIFQVTEGQGKTDLVWRQLTYQDCVERRSTRSVRFDPHICIQDDSLWLAYGAKIEKFKLLKGERHENNSSCVVM